MEKKYGLNRVLIPKEVFPASAWQLDNSPVIGTEELRIRIKKIHIESSSFSQLYQESHSNENIFKEKIMEIVQIRGKMHNPTTNTGGILYGQIEEIGSKCKDKKDYKVGDMVICTTSLTAIPLSIKNISSVDTAYFQIDVDGYAVLHQGIPLVKCPDNQPVDLMLLAFDESGTMYSVSTEAVGKNSFMIVADSITRALLFGYTIRRQVGKNAKIYCVLDNNSRRTIQGSGIDELINLVFNQVHYCDLFRPVEALDKLKTIEPVDMSVICTDILGAESINVFMTKNHGSVIFTEYNISNYNAALFITESIPRDLQIICATGYRMEYADYDLKLISEISGYFEEINRGKTSIKIRDITKADYVHNSVTEMAKAESFVANSKKMKQIIADINKVSKYDCNVLIYGQTGVGKEKIANMIQKNSPRKSQPFVKINCAAIAPSLIESELFGYEKGAFTGASNTGKKGYFETADNGTIFLDEIGELPLDFQAKLLRVIQEGEFMRVGGNKTIRTNVRLISATNKNLEEMITKKTFRQDLYYRLNVFQLLIPSLSERPEDIPVLVDTFAEIYNQKFGINKTFDQDAKEYMRKMPWPGNIRELENAVQRLLISSKGKMVTIVDIMNERHDKVLEAPVIEDIEDINLNRLIEEYESSVIRRAYEKYGSTRKAAKALGISQTQFVRKKNKAGITE